MKRSGALARFSQGRLRLVLTLFLLALAVPTTVLVYQAYGQLKWESFDQHRRMAEELSGRIGRTVATAVDREEARSAADYQFLVLAGDPTANFLQRSPLSAFPVASDIPGLIGYFEVDSDGHLTTPLLPPDSIDVKAYGVGPEEYDARLAHQRTLEAVLTENRLVRSRGSESMPLASADLSGANASLRGERASPTRSESRMPAPQTVDRQSPTPPLPQEDLDLASEMASAYEPEDRQDARILLDSLRQNVASDTDDGRNERETRTAKLGRVEDLALDATLQQRSLDTEGQRSAAQAAPSAKRARRKEQIALPQTVRAERGAEEADAPLEQSTVHDDEKKQVERSVAAGPAVLESAAEPARQASGFEVTESEPPPGMDRTKDNIARAATGIVSRAADPATVRGEAGAGASLAAQPSSLPTSDLRIMTFESEIDPFEFSLLDSGHFVLFRRVWRDGQRRFQGALIEQQPFLDGLFQSAYRATAVSQMSDLVIALGGDVFTVFRGASAASYASRVADVSGSLLYRGRLPAPLDDLEMVFSLNKLPTGPGGRLLGWVTLILATVLLGGFYLLYRLGSGQIALARQQQDFVSAVSHELKTPLTSIRMYGEMLKSGWADEDKKRSYYDYIHDESERLSRLIDNVLQLARLTRNDPHFDLQPVRVGELLDTTHSKISDHVQRAGFELEMGMEDDVAGREVRVDIDCFIQIVINLVDNAIKFASGAEHRLIRIRAGSGTAGKTLITVRDFGPGIPRDQRRKIFRLFYRSENELTRETVGTGIGLALVHQLTLAMNGSIDVRNREPGAEFRVSLPAA